jgi:hypothetical protein
MNLGCVLTPNKSISKSHSILKETRHLNMNSMNEIFSQFAKYEKNNV